MSTIVLYKVFFKKYCDHQTIYSTSFRTVTAIPVITTVRGAPILVTMKPANKLPKGVILLNAIA